MAWFADLFRGGVYINGVPWAMTDVHLIAALQVMLWKLEAKRWLQGLRCNMRSYA